MTSRDTLVVVNSVDDTDSPLMSVLGTVDESSFDIVRSISNTADSQIIQSHDAFISFMQLLKCST